MRGTTSSPRVHLVEGPQKLRVRRHDNGEWHSKAKQQVYDDEGRVPHISAVPVRSTGSSNPLEVKTTPSEERGCIPYKRPDPGEHHPGNSMSEEGRNVSWDVDRKVQIFHINMCVYLVWNKTAPMGLLTTTYRSTEMTPIVHRLAIPTRKHDRFTPSWH